ncbi:MAG: hypothetical protein JKY93_04480 [Gammaproteobacteria bacterium]|nr:hypothetical protein [Gammaproteobacteria bacterium]
MLKIFIIFVFIIFSFSAALLLAPLKRHVTILAHVHKFLLITMSVEFILILSYLVTATPEPSPRQQQQTIQSYIESLPVEVRGENAAMTRGKIDAVIAQADSAGEIHALKNQNATFKRMLSQLMQDIASTQQASNQQAKTITRIKRKNANISQSVSGSSASFTTTVALLNADIDFYGGYINLLWQPNDDKRAVCLRIQTALQAIGEIDGKINDDPETTLDALVAYKKKKDLFKNRHFDRKALSYIKKDYLIAMKSVS